LGAYALSPFRNSSPFYEMILGGVTRIYVGDETVVIAVRQVRLLIYGSMK